MKFVLLPVQNKSYPFMFKQHCVVLINPAIKVRPWFSNPLNRKLLPMALHIYYKRFMALKTKSPLRDRLMRTAPNALFVWQIRAILWYCLADIYAFAMAVPKLYDLKWEDNTFYFLTLNLNYLKLQNCPICRSPFKALFKFTPSAGENGSNQQSRLTLVEALNGPGNSGNGSPQPAKRETSVKIKTRKDKAAKVRTINFVLWF